MPDQRELDWALGDAVQRGDVAAVRMLLADGADPNTRDHKWGWPVLWVAAEQDYAEVAEALVKAGAPLDHHVLARAVGADHPETAATLLALGAPVNPEVPGMDSALECSLWLLHPLFRTLLQAG